MKNVASSSCPVTRFLQASLGRGHARGLNDASLQHSIAQSVRAIIFLVLKTRPQPLETDAGSYLQQFLREMKRKRQRKETEVL